MNLRKISAGYTKTLGERINRLSQRLSDKNLSQKRREKIHCLIREYLNEWEARSGGLRQPISTGRGAAPIGREVRNLSLNVESIV